MLLVVSHTRCSRGGHASDSVFRRSLGGAAMGRRASEAGLSEWKARGRRWLYEARKGTRGRERCEGVGKTTREYAKEGRLAQDTRMG